MTSRRSRSDDTVSLFPFLAVLICTMGSLIVLLVLVVQQAKASASVQTQVHDDRLAAERARLEEQREEYESLRWKTQMMQESREATLAELATKRLELSHFEDHIRQLRQRIEAAGQALRQLLSGQGADTAETEDLRRELERLTVELETASAAYEASVRAHTANQKSYAIVAYDGPHGTRRQPMFVECLADRVVLQPEGIALTGNDFHEPVTNDNPLALALRAKREYLASVAYREDAGEPYPLIIIRPGGERAYAVARIAMLAWDSEFGYELVPSELPLKFPEPDDALVEVMRAAVEEGRERRQQLQLMAPGRFGRASGATYRPSRSGGFARDDTSAADDWEFSDGLGDQRNAGGHHSRPSGPTSSPGIGRGPNDPVGFSAERGPTKDLAGTGAKPDSSGAEQDVGSGPAPASSSGPRTAVSSGNGAMGTGAAGGSGATGGRSGSSVFAGQPFSPGADSLARERGRDWGLPKRAADSIGIRRPISVICHPDRLVLPADERSRSGQQEFPLDGTIVDEVDRLVSELWQRMNSWGLAGTGMYWKPVLRVRVMEGAGAVYDELSRVLDGSGIEVKRK